MYVPEDARFQWLLELPEGANLCQEVNEAMKAIERENPALKDVLPKTYTRLNNSTLATLLKAFNSIPMDIDEDVFGRIYEYFLGNFAMGEGQRGVGENLDDEQLVIYDLLLKPQIEDFGRRVMQRLGVSYLKATNKQEGRVGSLFQGPFQNRLVTTDGDLIYLSRNIHLNPVTAGFVELPENWDYSSYQCYAGSGNGSLPHPEAVLCNFSSPEAYGEFVTEALEPEMGLAEALLFEDKVQEIRNWVF
jgi:hypothetical protein